MSRLSKPLPGARVIAGHALRPDVAYLLNEGAGSRVWDTINCRQSIDASAYPTWMTGDNGPALHVLAASSQVMPLYPFFLGNGNGIGSAAARFRTTSASITPIYAEYNTGNNATLWEIGSSGVSARMLIRNDANTLLNVTASVNANDGKWHTIVGVSTGHNGNVWVYFDGVLIATSANTTVGTTVT